MELCGAGVREARLAGSRAFAALVSMKNLFDQILDLLGLGVQLFIISNQHNFLMYFRASCSGGADDPRPLTLKAHRINTVCGHGGTSPGL